MHDGTYENRLLDHIWKNISDRFLSRGFLRGWIVRGWSPRKATRSTPQKKNAGSFAAQIARIHPNSLRRFLLLHTMILMSCIAPKYAGSDPILRRRFLQKISRTSMDVLRGAKQPTSFCARHFAGHVAGVSPARFSPAKSHAKGSELKETDAHTVVGITTVCALLGGLLETLNPIIPEEIC